MPLKHKPAGRITTDDIRALIDNGVPEGRDLEYKQVLPGGSNADKKEFLADVSSFANASGGVLVFGIRDAEGLPDEITGVGEIDADQEILRLENLMRDSLDPRIPGASIATLDLDGDTLVIIRVPRSWIGPHMVTYRGSSRFYSRNSRGKYPLDTRELRSAFQRSATTEDQVAEFRSARIARVLAEDTPVPLYSAPPIILHVIPYSSIHEEVQIDVTSLEPRTLDGCYPLRSSRRDFRFNFDGIVVYPNTDGAEAHAYLQIFRSGILETVNSTMLIPEDEEEPFIRSTVVEPRILEYLSGYLQLEQALGVPPPFAVGLTVVGVFGYRVRPDTQNRHWTSFRHPNDRNELILPLVIAEDHDIDVPQLMRPVFDALWNAAGWRRSMNYDEQGRHRLISDS